MKTCDKLLNMKRINTLKAKLSSAKQELKMRRRTSNSAIRAFNKVASKINMMENKIAYLAQIPKSD